MSKSLAGSRKMGWLFAVLAVAGCDADGGATGPKDGSAVAPEASVPDSSGAPAEAGAPDDVIPEASEATSGDSAFASTDANVAQDDSAAPIGPGDTMAGDECVNDPNCAVAGTNCGPENAVLTCVAGANGCLTAASSSLCGSHFVCVGAPGMVTCAGTP
ncbi:MAG TPA: hypothetical protein VK841_08370 [Polyangiaceae bacterium]|nr:hypothetical protein [Polyangiaceae bacterium]